MACQAAKRGTLCLSSTYAEDPHLCSLPPGRSPRGGGLLVTLQTGRTLVNHILVILWGLSVGRDIPQCPPESHKTGSVPSASSETHSRQWDTWKSCGTVGWGWGREWTAISDRVSSRNFGWLCQENIPWKMGGTCCYKDLVENLWLK